MTIIYNIILPFLVTNSLVIVNPFHHYISIDIKKKSTFSMFEMVSAVYNTAFVFHIIMKFMITRAYRISSKPL